MISKKAKCVAFCMIFSILFLLSMCGCIYKSYRGKRPADQHNTDWVSTQGDIRFHIGETVSGIGTMRVGEKTIPFGIETALATSIYLFHIDDMGEHSGVAFELWVADYKNADTFTATVKRTTYFKEGEQITFVKVNADSADKTTQ